MPDSGLPRLFLSYGRADASDIADKLSADLLGHDLTELARYETWKDRPEIKSGLPWTEQIADALRHVAGMIAILTPHAVRTRSSAADASDSVCLDEISYARFGAKKPIVPAMAIQCEPPFEIYRLDYVDFTGWKSDEQRYRAALRKLLESIVAALKGEVRYRRWNDRLRPWDFDIFLDSKRKDFVGRTWLFQAIRTWLDSAGGQQTLLIIGDPGIGKSALVAELVHRNPDGCVMAYHCCQANVPETLRPGRFVRSIAAMLASRHPSYEALIDEAPYRDLLIESVCDADPESAFDLAVLTALHKAGMPEGGVRVIVIDALDEALLHADPSGRTIPGLLARGLTRLPAWLKIVATSRPTPDVLNRLASLKPQTIAAKDPRNLADLDTYVAERLAREPLASRVAAAGKDAAWVTTTLKKLADGNFLYAQQALDGVVDNVIDLQDLGQLPPGLTNQFQWFFERQFGVPGRWELVKPLLETLVAAQEPLGDRELAAATGLDPESTLAQSNQAIAAYVRVSDADPPCRDLYHRSLVEWLTDPKRKGETYRVSVSEGHRRLAKGLLADYEADVLKPAPYALQHLSTHLAEAAKAAQPAARIDLQRKLAAFVLNPLVQQQRVDEPFGMNASLARALDTAASGPAIESAPIVFELARGWDGFRRERLDSSRLFELARQGRLDAFERELELYPADEKWVAAARLIAAWLAIGADRDGADRLRKQARTWIALDERVDAVFEQRASTHAVITQHPSEPEVAGIFAHVGGADAERGIANPSMLWDQAAPPPAGERMDAEGVRYLAEFHAPILVARAQDDEAAGTQNVRDYIALSAANAYRVYRNGSLWEVLSAVARHRDVEWVRTIAPSIVAAALAGSGRDCYRAVELTVLAAFAAADPARRADLATEQHRLLSHVAGLTPANRRDAAKGDPWGEYRRSIAAVAEARHLLLNEDGAALLPPALGLEGYAGFRAPACLTLAESLFVCGAPRPLLDQAMAEARGAAQNVQDLVFCARTTARVRALAEEWAKPAQDDLAIAAAIERFTTNPRLPEFSTVHLVGDTYPERQQVNPTSRLPGWLLNARSIEALSRAYQWPIADFLGVNDISDPKLDLPKDARVRVPDRRWAPMLAAYFAARVLRADLLPPREKVRLLLKLAVRAIEDATALDTILARLIVAIRPSEAPSIEHYAQVITRYTPKPFSDAPAFEPLV